MGQPAGQPWKKGRGKMGPMAPLIGCWRAEAETPMGPVACVRDYRKFGDAYVRLEAEWYFRPPKGQGAKGKAKKAAEPPKPYREVCMFGPDKDGALAFWSYTSDGKKSSGKLADGTDVHAQAVCFEAQMDAGLARQVFWPAGNGGMNWIVEARTKKGWSRLATHHYRPV
jgi:hypothetical protein